MRILFAEDDCQLRASIARGLREASYDVDEAGTGVEALALASDNDYDAIILDVLLPGKDGIAVCEAIREHEVGGAHVPILMLTALDAVEQRIAGLDAGADDYVTKPFRLAELLARVRALLRRNPTDASPAHDLVRIDPEGRRAWFRDEELQLTAKEFDLLRVLVREQGKVVSREQLMREIWETAWFGSTKTLDMHISVLRRKLGDDAAQPRYIATVRGVGFRFERGDES